MIRPAIRAANSERSRFGGAAAMDNVMSGGTSSGYCEAAQPQRMSVTCAIAKKRAMRYDLRHKARTAIRAIRTVRAMKKFDVHLPRRPVLALWRRSYRIARFFAMAQVTLI